MIAEISTIKKVCSGDFTKIANYNEAINDSKHMWHLHHKLGLNHSLRELKSNNMYYHRPPEELEFLCADNKDMIDTYDSIKTHAGKHADTKRRIESEFEFNSFVNELSRKQCADNKVISNMLQFESWIEGVLRHAQLKYRLDVQGLSVETGLTERFIQDVLTE